MSLSVLVVDDDPHMCELMKAVLESRGYEVSVALDVAGALKLPVKDGFDLIVTDLSLPEKDGMEFISELRRTRSTAHILAISGGGRLGTEMYLEIAKRLRVDAVLAKPFDASQFLEAVDGVLGQHAHGDLN
jgi:DNA-binding response OmpR family regulator